MRDAWQSYLPAAKSLVFCTVLLALLWLATFIFVPGPGTIQPWAAVSQTQGQADVLVLGSSTAHCTVLPMELWRENGITAIDVTAGALSMPATVAFLQQALTLQKPRVVMLEVHMLGHADAFSLENAHGAFDYMPLGPSWLAGITSSVAPGDWFELLFPMQRYHSRWAELSQWDYSPAKRSGYAFARGALYLPMVEPLTTDRLATDTTERAYLDELGYLRDIARRVTADGGRLVLFSAPSMTPDTIAGRAILERLEADLSKDFPTIAYLDLYPVATSIGVDPASDYKDKSHLNQRGAVKITHWLGDYLTAEFEVTDRRGEAFASQWNRDLVKYDKLFISGW